MAQLTEEQSAAILERVKILVDEDLSEDLYTQVIKDAADFVCAYTNRAVVPDDLVITVGDLAIVKINRLGTEGERSRSEAGENYSFNDAPANIFSLLNKRRVARVGGYNAVQKAQSPDDQSGD